ncbi:MAG: hypothetical protein ACM3P0_18090 [Acidobacteriota bacterium]
MLKHGISYQWLAEHLGTYYQKVQYAIDLQKEMPLSMYTSIMEVFEKHGFVVDSRDACQNLMHAAFKVNSRFGTEIKKLNDEIGENIKDEHFKADEKIRMRYKLQDMKKEFDEQMDQLIKLTENE